jgi:two-component sensor histidine kinase
MMRRWWREVDGPRISPPAKRGFGSLLIEQSLRSDGGRADMRFEPEGLLCSFEVPLRRMSNPELVTS